MLERRKKEIFRSNLVETVCAKDALGFPWRQQQYDESVDGRHHHHRHTPGPPPCGAPTFPTPPSATKPRFSEGKEERCAHDPAFAGCSGWPGLGAPATRKGCKGSDHQSFEPHQYREPGRSPLELRDAAALLTFPAAAGIARPLSNTRKLKPRNRT